MEHLENLLKKYRIWELMYDFPLDKKKEPKIAGKVRQGKRVLCEFCGFKQNMK